LLQAVFSYFGLELQMPRLSMLLGSAICLLVLPLWRRLLIQQILQITAERILFLGGDPFCHAIETYVCENKGLNMHCAGYLTDGESEPNMDDRVVGRIRDLRKVFRDIRPNRLVVSARCDEVKRVLPEVIYLRQGGIQVESSREMYESLFERAAFTGEDDPWSLALGSRTPPAPGLAEIVRSGFSWTLACLLLVAAAPVCASIIWWAGRRVSEGIVEREQVAGKNGRPFSRRRLRRANRRGWSGLADAWLQLQNVIQGEMALVGPQADLTEVQRTLAQRIPLYGRRLNLRPGITGWAQVHQTSDEVQETLIKLEYDLYYEKNQSLLMDLYILLQSMKLT
jgi:lipopolysaccharide/colanic/teichoic acid biosynthesis glycosyltransferase